MTSESSVASYGREVDIAELVDRLKAGAPDAGPSLVSLCGARLADHACLIAPQLSDAERTKYANVPLSARLSGLICMMPPVAHLKPGSADLCGVRSTKCLAALHLSRSQQTNSNTLVCQLQRITIMSAAVGQRHCRNLRGNFMF